MRVGVYSTVVTIGLLSWALAPPGEAQPPGPAAFCEVYPSAPACASGEVPCSTCHFSPPGLNPYGVDVAASLSPDAPRPLSPDAFTAGLADALRAAEDLDPDQDGYTSGEEIAGGSSPSDAQSVPAPSTCVDEDDDGWDLCAWDPAYVLRKVMIDVCGRSATMLEREALRQARDPRAHVHEVLDRCLDAEAWRGMRGRVWNLANRKVGPNQAVKSGKGVGPIPLADYDDDYAYFVWTQTDDRDARLVLTGQAFVSARIEDGETVYEEWDRTPEEDYDLRGYDRYQVVTRDRRAGLLTHRWFLMSNTMFTAIPRTTAAQAYRAFLGYELSKLEGLYPVAGEPLDYDARGVAAPGCAACHSTLDPLSQPFTRYEGIGGGDDYAEPYSYNPDRMDGFVPTQGARVADVPEAGVLFGQPVADLVEWAQVAAESEAFRRATVLDYWRLFLGEPPRASEQAEFTRLVDDFGATHGHRVEAMLHDLIDTEAYGVP